MGSFISSLLGIEVNDFVAVSTTVALIGCGCVVAYFVVQYLVRLLARLLYFYGWLVSKSNRLTEAVIMISVACMSIAIGTSFIDKIRLYLHFEQYSRQTPHSKTVSIRVSPNDVHDYVWAAILSMAIFMAYLVFEVIAQMFYEANAPRFERMKAAAFAKKHESVETLIEQ